MNGKLNLRTAILLSFLLTIVPACEKYDKDISGDINIYLLDEFETEGIRGVIMEDGIVLSTEPVIAYGELLEYNSVNHSFKLDPAASERILDLYQNAFAVTLGDEILYTGYFWSGFSSAIIDWVVVDLIEVEVSDKMSVKLGYPTLMEGVTIPDHRNDNRILSIFARDKKLKD